MATLTLSNVSFTYGSTPVLTDISAAFEPATFYAIVGPSGAGKSTLLALLAGLDSPTSGTVLFDDRDISKGSLTRHRRENVCLVFQNYNLIDYLSAEENLRLVKRDADTGLLGELGLSDEEAARNVMQLSGGQAQRVAIARALAADAPVILADEPTGNLDPATARGIVEILRSAAHDHGKTVIAVTHSMTLAGQADIALRVARGKLGPVKRKR